MTDRGPVEFPATASGIAVTHVCAKCGLPLTTSPLVNGPVHRCDGDYAWLRPEAVTHG